MGTPNNELLAQLRGAISSWTAEVGAAQQGLSQQIDGANTQLSRLLAVLQERQQLTTALSRANEELDRLKQAMQQDQLPAGAVTRYTVAQTPAADAATRALDSTIDRLQTAVQSWTSQVAHAQGGLLEQFATANRQLTQLLEILAEPAGPARPVPAGPGAADPALLEELEQLRHENRILSSEVHALNIEMETFRLGQESFASANLASETERAVKHRRDVDRLEKALAGREAELKEQRLDSEALAREADTLRKEAARLQSSEERLQSAADLQRQETAQHVSALGALSREMEALRRAFLGEDVQLAAPETEPPDVEASAGDSEALDEAEARIAALEAKVTQLGLEREEVAVLEARIAALKEQIAALEQRPTDEAFRAMQAQADALEAALAAAPAAEELAALREELERLRAVQADADEALSSEERESAGRADLAAKLQSRIADLESDLAELSARPTAEELAASVGRASELETRIAELESDLAELSARPTAEELAASVGRASELETRIAELESELAELSARPTAEELAASVERASELETQIAALREEVAAIAQRPSPEDFAAQAARANTLESALEQLRADSDTATEMAAEATALREQLALMQLLMQDLDERPEHGELEEAQDRVAALEEEVRTLESRLAAASDSQGEVLAAERSGLQAALAAMEAELATMKRREEETVATARTLLEEMETHRTYEAAQATALSQARNEAVRLLDALSERQQQLAAMGAALSAAEAAREELAVAVADDRTDEIAALNAAMARLEATARERESRIAVLEAELPGHAESLMKTAALEEALRAMRGRVDELEALALEAEAEESTPDPEMAAALASQESLIGQQARELLELRDARHTAEDRIAPLEQQREELAREHADLVALHAELAARHEALAGELEARRAGETGHLDALAEARSEAEVALASALEQEQALGAIAAELERKNAALEALEAEKASLGEETRARQHEIKEAMAQINQVLHERDELSEELEAEKSRRERIFAGTTGAGKSAAEAVESRDERARQQEILLAELAHPGESRSMGDILVNAKILTRAQLSEALDAQLQDPTQLLGTILIERDYTTDDAIAQAVACQLDKPVVNPMEVHIQKDALDALNRDLCTWHVCIPLRITPDRLVVAMANPLDESAIMKLRDVSQREITPVVGTPSHIMGAIDNCYGTF